MDAAQLKEDARQGRISVDRLVDLVVSLQQRLHHTQQQLHHTQQQLQQLQQQLSQTPTTGTTEPFSLNAEEQRQQKRAKKKRSAKKKANRKGRLTTAEKIERAERRESVFPDGVPPQDCKLSHTRVVWRLENGQAVLVAYDVYRGPKKQYGKIPGVLGRSEFAIEIVLAIAFLVYVVGLSFDKVCLLLQFFQKLDLSKSQAEATLKQLTRHWEKEFDHLCTLLAYSAIVQADETRWSINSVWAFLSEKVRLLFFGVHKDAATLQHILDPATFEGIMVSDNAAVYSNFSTAQKCWAHLLRKAIKLTLLEPTNEEYRDFTDQLLAIYQRACRLQRDRRYGKAGREDKVLELVDALIDLCEPMWQADLPPSEGLANDYRKLCNELMKLLLADELFTFVTAEPVTQPNGEEMAVPGTNNECERTLRVVAAARKTGRTSKTPSGARRRTVIVSVLESLRVHVVEFTLESVIAEVSGWLEKGQSCFSCMVEQLGLPPPPKSVLDEVLPAAGG
jgi:transposase